MALGLSKVPGISVDPDALPTNLVFFTMEASKRCPDVVAEGAR